MPDALFELRCASDDPIMEGFALGGVPSVLGNDTLLEDLIPAARSTGEKLWQPPSFAGIWPQPKVQGNVPLIHDSPGVAAILPAFSGRACDCLRQYLQGNGELLPLDTVNGEYYIFHITRFIDAVDHQRSKITYLKSDPVYVVDIHEYAMREDMIAEAHIFRAYDLPIHVIVSEAFVRTVLSSKLRGFVFVKIWPHPPGTNWRMTKPILT